MEIKKTALAGTTESSDIQITLSKGNDGIDVDLTSDVKKQFGDQIIKVITDTLSKFQITNAKVRAVDKGALDCVIKARTVAAASRALNQEDQINWEVL
ncbi:citrate lyase acyl carrier protein [Oenococcus sp. UCMA 16435]|nr:citrate lyase acyl carrier protein [Oenococcus sp. UCMA 16435]MDI4584658.1 citrate lyase acyl carrier protein [Oenococcus sp. UCMA 14587]